jgi:hypothetical protein
MRRGTLRMMKMAQRDSGCHGGSARDRRKSKRQTHSTTGDEAFESGVMTAKTDATEKPEKASSRVDLLRAKQVWQWWKVGWGFVGPVVLFIASHQPSVHMTTLPPTNDDRPLAAPFQITNDSSFDIKSVRVSCQAVVDDQNNMTWKSTFHDPANDVGLIASQETATVSCASANHVPPGPMKGDLFFHLRFRYAWWPFRITKHYAFQVYTEGGKTYFLLQPSKYLGFPDHPTPKPWP